MKCRKYFLPAVGIEVRSSGLWPVALRLSGPGSSFSLFRLVVTFWNYGSLENQMSAHWQTCTYNGQNNTEECKSPSMPRKGIESVIPVCRRSETATQFMTLHLGELCTFGSKNPHWMIKRKLQKWNSSVRSKWRLHSCIGVYQSLEQVLCFFI
jgi:hypothetical protein